MAKRAKFRVGPHRTKKSASVGDRCARNVRFLELGEEKGAFIRRGRKSLFPEWSHKNRSPGEKGEGNFASSQGVRDFRNSQVERFFIRTPPQELTL